MTLIIEVPDVVVRRAETVLSRMESTLTVEQLVALWVHDHAMLHNLSEHTRRPLAALVLR